MSRSLTMILAAAILSVGMVVAAGRLVGAQGGADHTVAEQTPPSPVVAAMPYYQETEYLYQPFRRGEIDTTRTTTETVVLVHADGTLERKNVR